MSSAKPVPSNTPSKTVYFVRHGQSQANADGLLAGARTDSPLTELGKSQAKTAAKRLIGKQIDVVVSSPLERANHTAQIIAEGLGYKGEIHVSPLFTERDFGSATGLSRAEARILLDNDGATGVESIPEFEGRVKEALQLLVKLPATHILLVGHNAFGRMTKTVMEGGDPEKFRDNASYDHSEIYEFHLP